MPFYFLLFQILVMILLLQECFIVGSHSDYKNNSQSWKGFSIKRSFLVKSTLNIFQKFIKKAKKKKAKKEI